MGLRRTIDAATEPVSLAEAKAHLRLITADDDALINALIKAVRNLAEHETNRSLITQTWEKTLDEFPDAVVLHYPPILSILSVGFSDSYGVVQALSAGSYKADLKSEPGYLIPAFGLTWPSTRNDINSVTVTYLAGYGTAADVPQAIKQWMLLMVGHLYENREAVSAGVQMSALPYIDGLLDPYRVYYIA